MRLAERLAAATLAIAACSSHGAGPAPAQTEAAGSAPAVVDAVAQSSVAADPATPSAVAENSGAAGSDRSAGMTAAFVPNRSFSSDARAASAGSRRAVRIRSQPFSA